MLIYADTLTSFFVPTSLQADGRFLCIQLSLFPAGRVLQEILVQAGQMLPASGKPAPAAEVLSLQCKIVDTLQPTPNIPYLLDLSQAFLNLQYHLIHFYPFHAKSCSLLFSAENLLHAVMLQMRTANIKHDQFIQPGRQAHPTVPPLAPPNSGRFG